MLDSNVFLPENVSDLKNHRFQTHVHESEQCRYGCENTDSFTLARKNAHKHPEWHAAGEKEILVLNFANPVNPGGGVRRGARAQEEDLCRKSTLLCSLESDEAFRYYDYNRKLRTYMGSDGIIISPKVEILKDSAGNLLEDSVVVAVMTCAAPMITYGKEGMSEEEYRDMFLKRIEGMLRVAAYFGYRHLVLGAFGCGAFRNDARVVSDLFYRALREFEFDGMREKDFFRQIDFAVLSRSTRQYNYKEFYRNFGGDGTDRP